MKTLLLKGIQPLILECSCSIIDIGLIGIHINCFRPAHLYLKAILGGQPIYFYYDTCKNAMLGYVLTWLVDHE